MTWKGALFPFLAITPVYLMAKLLGLGATPYTFLLVAVVASTWYCGTWSGILATALACAAQPTYLITWNPKAYYDSGEFILSCSVAIYFNHQRLKSNMRLEAEHQTHEHQRDELFRRSIELTMKGVRESLTAIVGYAELSLPAESKELEEIRAAAARASRLLAEVQILAAEQKK